MNDKRAKMEIENRYCVVIILRIRNYYNKNAACHAVCGDRIGNGSFVYWQNVYRK